MNKKKVVHIISNLSLGGAQILVLDILKNLKKKSDLDVTLITIDSGEFMENYKNEGIKVYDLKEKGLVNINIYFKLKKLLSDIKPNLVHTHLNKADFYGRIAAKKAKVPIVVSTCHNYSTTHTGADINKKSVFDRIDDLVINYSGSYLIAISELVKKYLINRNNKFAEKTIMIYNGVDSGKSKYVLSPEAQIIFRQSNSFKTDDFVITISGRLEKQKGHMFFLKSIIEILENNKNIKVLILGEGSLRETIKSFISENDLTDQVILKGFNKDIEPYIEISDLICVPSLWEGFGLVIIEGMLKRKIVLASAVGGIPEIITDGCNGFLFEKENKEDFKEKFLTIYNRISDLENVKDNAYNTILEKFDIEKNSELYYNFYRRLFDNK
ncbi:MAG TPA: glycosyltransferase [Ignavibacteria bacterium]|nr:glycosyltransferase [Ignavibacteria bacterium]HMR40229.1 glycosyltransferase [Ignavibacteria bacterium]